MGLAIFETMDRLFPGKIEGISFSTTTKEVMATTAKRRIEERRCRLPNDQAISQSFRSVRRSTTSLGQIRFDAAHAEKSDHCDRWWAFCLAEAAVEQGATAVHLVDLPQPQGKPIFANFKTMVL